MKPETISAIKDFSLKARALLEKEVGEQLEGLYGFLPSGQIEPANNYPALSSHPEARGTRTRIEELLKEEETAGLSAQEVRLKFIKETAFTWLNRFVAFRMMESRGLIRQTVAKGQQSNGFKLWLTEPDNKKFYEMHEKGDLPQNDLGEGPRQEAYRYFILNQCWQLALEIKVLFDPEDLFSRLFPRPHVLVQLFEIMNAGGLDEAWTRDNEETIGWVYQYFIKEDKAMVFNKIYTQKKKMDLRDIPAATQIFTPKWMVRYLVENTLGRLWLRMHPDSDLMEKMKYYVPNDNDHQPIPLKPVKEITLLDPACGTMHFGMVAFDLFYEMYQEEMGNAGQDGWPKDASVQNKGDIPACIIENNLFGIDLDLRSIQLSALSLFIKAKSKNGSVTFNRINLTYTDIPEFPQGTINSFVDSLDTSHAVTKKLLKQILPVLNKAYYLGSLLKIEKIVKDFIEKERVALKDFKPRQLGLFGPDKPDQLEMDLYTTQKIVWSEVKAEIFEAFQKFFESHKEAEGAFVANETIKGLGLIDALMKKHDVVVCNPPYSGRRNMNEVLRNDLKGLYPKKDGDLYTVFIDRCLDLTSDIYGFLGMVTVHSFMFTSSHEDIRKEIINNTEIETMAHLGTKTEFDVANKTAQGFTMYALGKVLGANFSNSSGIYFRLVNENEEEKHFAFLTALQNYLSNPIDFSDPHIFILEQEKLTVIPGWPLVYWVSEDIRSLFKKKLINDVAKSCQGIATADNDRFLRYWWESGKELTSFNTTTHKESSKSGIKWFPYMKGGEVRRWWGNQEHIINWYNAGYEVKNFFKKGKLASRPQNLEYCFKEGATYSFLTVSNLSVRYLPKGFIFDVIGSSIFPKNISLFLLMGILNSKLSTYLIKVISPTVAYQVGDLARIPVPDVSAKKDLQEAIERNVKSCILLKKQEVRLIETSWDFLSPLHWSLGIPAILEIEKKLATLETDISQDIYQLYGIKQSDIDQIEAEYGTLPGKLLQIEDLTDPQLKIIEKLYLERHIPDKVINQSVQVIEDEDQEDEESNEESAKGRGRQKRFLTFEELCLASGFYPETVYAYITTNKLERPEERYELAVSWVSYAIGILLGRFKPGQKGELGSAIDEEGKTLLNIDIEKIRKFIDDDGIMVLDPGHSNDLQARVEMALSLLLGETKAKEVITVLGGDLRKFLERDFFTKWHIPQYRKRPVYWLLQSPRKTYGLYIFNERINKDALFRIRTEYVEPKINLLESQIGGLKEKRDNAEGREKRVIDKEIGNQIEILDDVREFKKFLKTIIEERRYTPHIDDGVLLNMAPLWELIPSWQTEPKKAWQDLEQEKFEWAYQAMDHWPDRVKEKCKTDKSLAIAHGREE
jgi:hypothetical protein